MENNEVDFHERDPHFDGDNEGIIPDPSGGPEIGIRSDIDPNNLQQKSPFGDIKLKTDKKMERFKKTFE